MINFAIFTTGYLKHWDRRRELGGCSREHAHGFCFSIETLVQSKKLKIEMYD
jgi:hypothetical protein